MVMGNLFTPAGMGNMGSYVATAMFIYAMFQQYFPQRLQDFLERYAQRLLTFFNPYIQIKFHEYTGDRFERSEAFASIESYLAENSVKTAMRLKADIGNNSKKLGLKIDDNEEVKDEFQGAELWWASEKTAPKGPMSISMYPSDADDNRYYKLTFHRKNRGLVKDIYLNHVMESGKELEVKNRQKRLYTNQGSDYRSLWRHVVFKHPATFRTLAMDEDKKKDIINDLTMFSKAKEYYEEIGKAWKRGYLLYGPPGTGKSTMIAAIANFMDYDVYDLELTAVKNNTELRKLLIESSNKSVIVIEDIDCSLDLTAERKKIEEEKEEKNGKNNSVVKKAKEKKKSNNKEDSKVTLSGLLNFIDGLWSVCGEERIIVFTTNYIEKLDPALIRRGRMDKHIEMSYCTFGAFKVLAKNYLKLDSHHLFDDIEELLKETEITPADVAENLMPKALEGDFVLDCLENLIQVMKDKKEEAARLKAEEAAAVKEQDISNEKEAEAKSDSKENTETKSEAKENAEAKSEAKEKDSSDSESDNEDSSSSDSSSSD
ncbi:hypothetical protein ACHQM5_006002 [Ranunculus cassubicifolius]